MKIYQTLALGALAFEGKNQRHCNKKKNAINVTAAKQECNRHECDEIKSAPRNATGKSARYRSQKLLKGYSQVGKQ